MKTDIKTINYEATWPIRHSVMWPDKPFDYVKLPEDNQGTHYGLFVEEKLVSIVSVFINSEGAQFRKFATLQEHQGKGHGSQLLTHVIQNLENRSINCIWCNARVDKSDYYGRFGLVATKKMFTKGGIQFVIMEKHRASKPI